MGGFYSRNSPNKLLERIRFGHAEIHPLTILQRPRQLRRFGCVRQDRRNDGTFPPHKLAEEGLNLLILPWANTTIADKNRSRIYIFDLLSERRLPRRSGADLFFIQPWFDLFLSQLPRDLANSWLVLAVVAQEDVKDFALGVLGVHTEPLFRSIIGEALTAQWIFQCSKRVNNPVG